MEQSADGRYGPFKYVDKSFNTFIDGGVPGSYAKVLLAHDREQGEALTPQVGYVRFLNRGASSIVGVGVRFMSSMWVAGQWTHGATTYTDDTTDFKDTGTADAALETTTNNDGFLVGCLKPFNALSMLISTASTGSPARVVEYSLAGGSWATILGFNIAVASTNYSVGENVLWFVAPADWAVMEAGHGTGVPTGYFGLRVRSTTAPTVAGLATSMTVHHIQCMAYSLGTNSIATLDFGGLYAPWPGECDAIVGCTNNASSANNVQMIVRTRG